MSNYIHATPEAGKAFYQQFHQNGAIVMINLVKYKAVADYTTLPELNPKKELTGKEAYNLYLHHTLPHVTQVGGRLRFFGKAGAFVIGPEAKKWDAVIMVEYPSVAKFMELTQNADYLKTAGHRTAALADSRLLPSNEMTGVLPKEVSKNAHTAFNLHGKKFTALNNSDNGEVSAQTQFEYRQKDDIIWATYGGGEITFGTLSGTIKNNEMMFTYQHQNKQGHFKTGKCHTVIEEQNGALILNETWEWTCDDHSKGSSVLHEMR